MGADVIVNAAILHHMGLDVLCRAVVFVTAPFPARLLRAMRRDRLPLRDALARITSQKEIGLNSMTPVSILILCGTGGAVAPSIIASRGLPSA